MADTTIEPIPQPITDSIEQAPELVAWGMLPALLTSTDEQPDVKRPELVAMEKWWKLGDVLLGGTPAIREAADELLPALGTEEERTERDARIRKAIATPFYVDTIERLVAKPFGRPIRFVGFDGDQLPEQLDHLRLNADGAGKTLSALARDHLFEAIHRSGDCLLVDLPTQELPRSLADVVSRRPLIRQIKLRDVLGWSYRIDEAGNTVTTGLRLREVQKVKTGIWSERDEEVVRLIQATLPGVPGYSVVYRRNERGEWALDQESARPFPNSEILLRPTWTNQLTPTSGRSKMTHLAELNMAYIVGDCEQQYGASYARVSTVYSIGLDSPGNDGGKLGQNVDAAGLSPIKKTAKRVVRGHLRHIRLPESATIGMLETSGSGLAAGRAELDNMEKRMERFGANHVAVGGVTATSIRSDDERDTSNLRSWVGRVEDTLTQVLKDAARLAGIELPSDFRVELFRDWAQAEERQQAMPHVFAAFDRTLVPARIVHDQLRRFGVLVQSDTTDELLQEANDEKIDRLDSFAEAQLRSSMAMAGGQLGGEGGPGEGGQQNDDPADESGSQGVQPERGQPTGDQNGGR